MPTWAASSPSADLDVSAFFEKCLVHTTGLAGGMLTVENFSVGFNGVTASLLVLSGQSVFTIER